MSSCRITVASLPSLLAYPERNLDVVRTTVETGARAGSRIVVLPELMLTGHGAHRAMIEHAEALPSGPLSSAIVDLSKQYEICICVGIAELCEGVAYNSQMVVDRGDYLGCQRKIHPSGDEYVFFAPGTEVPIFDIGDARFGISICYDSCFPEFSLIHSLGNVDMVFSVHAARTGVWPDTPDRAFATQQIKRRQTGWYRRWAGRAEDYNFFVVLCDVVGPSTVGLTDVVANHAGSVMAIDPRGEIILETERNEFEPEIRSFDIDTSKRGGNHAPTRNRRLDVFQSELSRSIDSRKQRIDSSRAGADTGIEAGA